MFFDFVTYQKLRSKKMQITTEINERFMIYESGQVARY